MSKGKPQNRNAWIREKIVIINEFGIQKEEIPNNLFDNCETLNQIERRARQFIIAHM